MKKTALLAVLLSTNTSVNFESLLLRDWRFHPTRFMIHHSRPGRSPQDVWLDENDRLHWSGLKDSAHALRFVMEFLAKDGAEKKAIRQGQGAK